MSDTMLFGVLRMPYEMAMADEVSRYQFWQRAQEAANRLEAAERTTPPSTSTAETAACEAIAKWNSLPDAKLVYDARAQTAACGGTGPKSYALPPSTASEVGELPPLPSLPETLQNAMVDYRLAPQNDRASKAAVILAIQAYAESYARAALAAKPVAREVDVEAERKLFETWYEEQPLPYVLARMDPQQAAFNAWLAARRTQEGAKDAERFRQAIACEDSAEVLYGAVLSHAPNGKAIRNEFDAAIAATQSEEQRG